MIKIGKFLVAYDSMTYDCINPEYLWLTEKEIREYMKEHPMPEDPEYTPEELIKDLTNSSGMYCLPMTVKPETISYIEDLLNAIIK